MTGDSSQLEVLKLNQTPKVLFATIPSVIFPCIHQFVHLSLFPGSCYIASMNWAFVSGPKPGRANNKVTLAFVLGLSSEKACKKFQSFFIPVMDNSSRSILFGAISE